MSYFDTQDVSGPFIYDIFGFGLQTSFYYSGARALQLEKQFTKSHTHVHVESLTRCCAVSQLLNLDASGGFISKMFNKSWMGREKVHPAAGLLLRAISMNHDTCAS